ncbi:hypothetical protein BofuT4_P136850.1 [Botrytis cinerea T4]|uniref:Uncharacterized protein n=1 Tax=Botryotinia fuckeliana (strain T4) TaxID=999810 RepID=G2YPU2_BOTF4|nr:hypothetical protein BofuT4_P136850.1 [Botrytis cinerea T4]
MRTKYKCQQRGWEERDKAENSQRELQEEDMVDENYYPYGSEDRPRKFWVTELPDPEDADFRKFTHRSTNDSSSYELGDDQCSVWESHPDHECYSSFGDGGTTATVNAFGQLMQFSTYLGPGKSGMFSVNHSSLSRPWYVRGRANQLDHMSRARNRTVRKYVHCRWPRYEYQSEKAKLVNQWMVHHGVVLQQWRFISLDTEEISTKIAFSKDMRIRDVQDQTWNGFVNSYSIKNSHHFLGPESYSWVFLYESSKDDSANTEEARLMDNSIGVILSVFIDGLAMKFHSDEE